MKDIIKKISDLYFNPILKKEIKIKNRILLEMLLKKKS